MSIEVSLSILPVMFCCISSYSCISAIQLLQTSWTVLFVYQYDANRRKSLVVNNNGIVAIRVHLMVTRESREMPITSYSLQRIVTAYASKMIVSGSSGRIIWRFSARSELVVCARRFYELAAARRVFITGGGGGVTGTFNHYPVLRRHKKII